MEGRALWSGQNTEPGGVAGTQLLSLSQAETSALQVPAAGQGGAWGTYRARRPGAP